jgi:hypothetical protein
MKKALLSDKTFQVLVVVIVGMVLLGSMGFSLKSITAPTLLGSQTYGASCGLKALPIVADDFALTASGIAPVNKCPYSSCSTAPWVGGYLANGIVGTDQLVTEYREGRSCGTVTTYAVRDDNPAYRLSKVGCPLGNTELLVAQTFAGGRVISTSSFATPFKRFCAAVPAVVTDANTQGSYTDLQLYWNLAQGQSVTVPASTTYTLFWATDQAPQIAYQCSANFIYDGGAQKCIASNAFAYVCGADSSFVDGKCVTQPAIFCPINTTYDAAKNRCMATDAIIDCTASGYPNAQWDSGRSACVWQPPITILQGETKYVCPDGVTIADQVSGTCPVEGVLVSVCTLGGVWEESTHTCVKELAPEIRVPAAQYDCSAYDTLSGAASYNTSTGLCDVAPDSAPSANTVKVEVVPMWVWYVVGGAVLLMIAMVLRQRKVI